MRRSTTLAPVCAVREERRDRPCDWPRPTLRAAVRALQYVGPARLQPRLPQPKVAARHDELANIRGVGVGRHRFVPAAIVLRSSGDHLPGWSGTRTGGKSLVAPRGSASLGREWIREAAVLLCARTTGFACARLLGSVEIRAHATRVRVLRVEELITSVRLKKKKKKEEETSCVEGRGRGSPT